MRFRTRGAASVAVGTLLLGWLVAMGSARANGRFPSTNYLTSRPGTPDELLLRATFGMLRSTDGGKSWRWVCERAIGYSGVQDPPVSITEGGAIAAALFEGLALSTDGGCHFRFVGGELAKEVLVDVTVPRTSPSHVWALTGTHVSEVDGGSLFRSKLVVSKDGGASWKSVGPPLDPTLIVESFEVAPTDPDRVYVTAIRSHPTLVEGVFLVSNDGGKHWTKRTVPIEPPSERAPFIAAVDPKDKERVYVRTAGAERSRLLVTEDGGGHFRAVFEGKKLAGFALSPDGETVYVGGLTEGLHAAARKDLRFEKRSAIEVGCLHAVGARLYACSNETSGFILGASDDGGKTFTPALRFHTIQGQLQCASDGGVLRGPGDDVCGQEWTQLVEQFSIGDDPPGSSGTDGGKAKGETLTTGKNKSSAKAEDGSTWAKRCGCAHVAGPPTLAAGSGVGSRGGSVPWMGGLVLLGGLVTRRRRLRAVEGATVVEGARSAPR